MFSTQFKDFSYREVLPDQCLGFSLGFFFVLVLYFEFSFFPLLFLHLLSHWKIISEVIANI